MKCRARIFCDWSNTGNIELEQISLIGLNNTVFFELFSQSAEHAHSILNRQKELDPTC